MPAAFGNNWDSELKTKTNGCHANRMDIESELDAKLVNKKLDQMIEEANETQSSAFLSKKEEQFYDTRSFGAHSKQHSYQDEEPLVIFDTLNNTSIAQTALDQFAAALLRLQSGLDESSARMNALESKMDNIVRQQRQQVKANQGGRTAANKSHDWFAFPRDNKFGSLLYLSWPVLVFVAMRALERKALLKRFD